MWRRDVNSDEWSQKQKSDLNEQLITMSVDEHFRMRKQL